MDRANLLVTVAAGMFWQIQSDSKNQNFFKMLSLAAGYSLPCEMRQVGVDLQQCRSVLSLLAKGNIFKMLSLAAGHSSPCEMRQVGVDLQQAGQFRDC